MTEIERIKQPFADQLEQYERYLRGALGSESSFVASILDHIFAHRGKGIRPLLALLSAGVCAEGRPLGERTWLAAMLVEMVHTASLVHDDVIDEARIRHGQPSVNMLWSSHTAVIAGDYILAKTYLKGMESGQYDIVRFVTRSLGSLCEGELIQSDQSQRLEMTREIYLDIIYKKTATLLGTSCGAGAVSVGAAEERVALMTRLGERLGMAFQIKDDLLDYSPASQTGKPACADLRERKITLPLLAVLEKSTPRQRHELLEWLSDVTEYPENIERIAEIVTEQGGMEMAAEVMNDYIVRSREIVSELPESPYRTALDRLCTFISTRNK